MAKSSGLGDNLYVGGYNTSGDIGSLGAVGGGPALLSVTGIDKSAFERIGGTRDGRIEYTAFFNSDLITPATHQKLAALPTANQMVTYARGTTIGADAACLIGKQINYDPTRGDDGSLTFGVQALANGFGLEWGNQLTAGLRNDTTATNGTGLDTAASAAFGAQAYLQVTGFTGTTVTIKVQDSADNVTFADVTGLTFAAVTAAPATERLATANNATIRRYLRVATTGTFSSVTFSVVIVKNETAGVVF